MIVELPGRADQIIRSGSWGHDNPDRYRRYTDPRNRRNHLSNFLEQNVTVNLLPQDAQSLLEYLGEYATNFARMTTEDRRTSETQELEDVHTALGRLVMALKNVPRT